MCSFKKSRLSAKFCAWGVLVIVNVSLAVASDLSGLGNPEFIGYSKGKAVYVHDKRVLYLEVTDELKLRHDLPDPSFTDLQWGTYRRMHEEVNEWLFQLKMHNKEVLDARKNRNHSTGRDQNLEVGQSAEVRELYTSKQFDKEYNPDLHNGEIFTVSGVVTSITSLSEESYQIVLDEFITFNVTSDERILGRGIDGAIKRISGGIEVGKKAVISGLCSGVGASGYVDFQNGVVR